MTVITASRAVVLANEIDNVAELNRARTYVLSTLAAGIRSFASGKPGTRTVKFTEPGTAGCATFSASAFNPNVIIVDLEARLDLDDSPSFTFGEIEMALRGWGIVEPAPVVSDDEIGDYVARFSVVKA